MTLYNRNLLHHAFWEFPRFTLWNFKRSSECNKLSILYFGSQHFSFTFLSAFQLIASPHDIEPKEKLYCSFFFDFLCVFLKEAKEDEEGKGKKFLGCKDVIAVEYESTVDKEKKSFNSFIINHAPLFLHRSHRNLPQESSVIHTKIYLYTHIKSQWQ